MFRLKIENVRPEGSVKQAKINRLTGFRDFYPEEMAFRNWLFGKMRQVAKEFGYQEYAGPALEKLSLYEAKSGEELVKKQAYIFKDKKGEKIALRPEMTPTLARMVAQKKSQLIFPLRWFNIGPRWRYERPQRGRFREFWQWDVDLIGVNSPEADAEIIALAASFLKALRLTPEEVVIKVNNRRLIEQKLDLIEIPLKKKPLIFSLIDKKDKLKSTAWDQELLKNNLTPLQIKDLKGILQDKDFSNESEELTAIFSTLKDLGVDRYVEFDPSVVRGLDYYTGTVFEGRDRAGEFRAILGGGRYDSLVTILGGEEATGVGFAAGDAVLTAVLAKYQKIPKLAATSTQVLVTIFNEGLYREALTTASLLRKKGIATELFPTLVKLDNQLKYADRKGIPLAVIIGPIEAKGGMITLKNLKTKTQKTISQENLVQEIRKTN